MFFSDASDDDNGDETFVDKADGARLDDLHEYVFFWPLRRRCASASTIQFWLGANGGSDADQSHRDSISIHCVRLYNMHHSITSGCYLAATTCAGFKHVVRVLLVPCANPPSI